MNLIIFFFLFFFKRNNEKIQIFISQSLTFKEKMTTSLKFKEKSADLDSRSLLLALVKLLHADPKLMLHVSLYHLAQASFSPLIAKSLKSCKLMALQ